MACDARSCKCRWALGASHCGRCSATVNHTAIYAYSHSAASTAHKNNSCGSKGPLLPTLAGSVTSIQLSYTPTTCAVQEDAFTDWLTYVLIFVVIFTAVAQMKCAYRCTYAKPTGCDSPSHSFASVRLSSAERPWPLDVRRIARAACNAAHNRGRGLAPLGSPASVLGPSDLIRAEDLSDFAAAASCRRP